MIGIYIVETEFAGHKVGDKVQLESDAAEALSSYVREATAEDLGSDLDDVPADDVDAPVEDAALKSVVNKLSKNIEASIAKATESAWSRNSGAKIPSVPAQLKQPVYKSMGAMLHDVYHAKKGGNRNAQNRLQAYQNEMSVKSPLGAASSPNSAGGYDIKPEWTNEIFVKARDYPRLLDRTERMSISGNTLNIPALSEASLANGARHGGVRGYWVGESDAATYSNPALGQVQIVLGTNIVLVPATMQLLQDANIEAFDKFIAKMAGLELVFQENNALLNGSSNATGGVGLLNQTCAVTVTKSSNDTAAMFGYDDLAKMYRTMWGPSRKNAIWLVTSEAYAVLLQMAFVTGAGTVTQYPAFGGITFNASDEFPMKIFGNSVVEWVGNPNQLGLPGDIIFVDLSQITTAEHPTLYADVSDEYAFTTAQTLFRFIRRYSVGSPWLTSIGSYDTAYSYSPIVLLSSRGT